MANEMKMSLKFEQLAQIDQGAYLRHQQWMEKAIVLAQEAGEAGDVPVGAVVVDGKGQLIGSGANRKERDQDPTAHAEIIALRQAAQNKQNWHLNDCTLYVTLEPCPMCTGAIIQGRIKLLVYGADDPKTGTIRSVFNLPDSACSNHRLAVLAGVKECEVREQLQSWFALKRR